METTRHYKMLSQRMFNLCSLYGRRNSTNTYMKYYHAKKGFQTFCQQTRELRINFTVINF